MANACQFECGEFAETGHATCRHCIAEWGTDDFIRLEMIATNLAGKRQRQRERRLAELDKERNRLIAGILKGAA